MPVISVHICTFLMGPYEIGLPAVQISHSVNNFCALWKKKTAETAFLKPQKCVFVNVLLKEAVKANSGINDTGSAFLKGAPDFNLKNSLHKKHLWLDCLICDDAAQSYNINNQYKASKHLVASCFTALTNTYKYTYSLQLLIIHHNSKCVNVGESICRWQMMLIPEERRRRANDDGRRLQTVTKLDR